MTGGTQLQGAPSHTGSPQVPHLAICSSAMFSGKNHVLRVGKAVLPFRCSANVSSGGSGMRTNISRTVQKVRLGYESSSRVIGNADAQKTTDTV